MHRRTKFIVLGSLLLLGLFAVTYLVAKPLTEQPTVTLLYPKEPTDSMLWPTNQSWVWSVNRLDAPAKGNSLAVVVRMVHQPLKKGEGVSVAGRIISRAESEGELTFGRIVWEETHPPAFVSVQLVDLGEIAAPVEKGRLRLLLQLRRGGGSIFRNGTQSVIDGESIACHGFHDNPQWKDGELHLQNLYVRTRDGVTIYDVVVIQSE